MSLMIERRNVAGIEFTVARPATPEAETLICLHGIGGDDASFLPQIEGLSNQYQVVAWNMPGYSQSQKLPNMTFENLANALSEFIFQSGIESVHLVGQSIGGMVAQEFAHRYPDQLKSLVLIGTTSAFGGRDDSFKNEFLAARLQPLDAGVSMPDLARQAVPQIVGRECPQHVVDAAIESMAKVKSDTYRDVLQCLVTFNRYKELEELSHPVCLIAGTEDTNSPAVTMQKMAARLANAEYHELQGAGHLINIEMPVATNQIIIDFIEKCCAAKSPVR